MILSKRSGEIIAKLEQNQKNFAQNVVSNINPLGGKKEFEPFMAVNRGKCLVVRD